MTVVFRHYVKAVAQISSINRAIYALATDFRIFLATKILLRSFQDNGNFSFGIKSYIDIPGEKYDPEIGLMGFDVTTTEGIIKNPKRKVKGNIAEIISEYIRNKQ